MIGLLSRRRLDGGRVTRPAPRQDWSIEVTAGPVDSARSRGEGAGRESNALRS
jgi:hypothetical protein